MNSRGFTLLTEAKILQPDNFRRWELENWIGGFIIGLLLGYFSNPEIGEFLNDD